MMFDLCKHFIVILPVIYMWFNLYYPRTIIYIVYFDDFTRLHSVLLFNSLWFKAFLVISKWRSLIIQKEVIQIMHAIAALGSWLLTSMYFILESIIYLIEARGVLIIIFKRARNFTLLIKHISCLFDGDTKLLDGKVLRWL